MCKKVYIIRIITNNKKKSSGLVREPGYKMDIVLYYYEETITITIIIPVLYLAKASSLIRISITGLPDYQHTGILL